MIFALTIFVCIIFLLISQLYKNQRLNTLCVFNLLWLIVVVLSKLRLYGLYEASQKAYIVILVGILCFDLGYCMLNKKLTIKAISNKYKARTYEINYKFILALCCLEFLLRLSDLKVTIPSLLNGQSLEIIRKMQQDTGSELYTNRSGIETALRTLFMYPFLTALIPTAAVDFWMGKRDKALQFATIGLSVIAVFCSGGRGAILMFAVSYAAIYFLSGNYLKHYATLKKLDKRKRKRIFIVSIVAAAVILIATTLSRAGQNTIRFLYYYFAMPPYMLSEWMNTIEQGGLYAYGMSSFCGYTFTIVYLIKNLLRLSSYPEFFYDIVLQTAATDQEWLIISSMGSPANAYVSLFWFPYYDGRIIGVIAILFLFGVFVKQIYIRARNFSDLRMVAIYVLLLYGIFMSFVRFQFSSTSHALAFIYILLMFKRRRGNNTSLNISDE